MRSLSSRFIAIFVILVLATTLIFGVLFTRFLYQYDIENIEKSVDRLAERLIPKLNSYDSFEKNSSAILSFIDTETEIGYSEQIFVVSKNKIIATSSENLGGDIDNILDSEILILSELGEKESKICSVLLDGTEFRTFDKAFPIERNGKQLGSLYIKYSLKDLDESSSNSFMIMVQSLAISLGFSLILAILIASSITRPINKITNMAAEISMGNFEEKILINSEDEIGKLSKMFNHMAEKLSTSLNETYREKNKMEAILNNIIDGIIAVNDTGEVLHINPSAKYMLTKLSVFNTTSYKDLSQFFPSSLAFENIISLKEPKEFRETIEAGKSYFEARCENYYDERGSKKGIILVFQDITKEHKLEKMRRDFIANVSHELKTPITSVKSYSETMLEMGEMDNETSEYFLKVINSEADRMSALVNDLLQLSALDAGKITLKIEKYSLNKMFENILRRFDMQIKKENMTYSLKLPEEEVLAEFDYDRIEQVISNLLTNAIKYSEAGSKIEVILNRNYNVAEIIVKDNGIGIPKKDLAKLFNRFYRVEKSRQRKAGGSGLGLSIVKQILNLHHADIRVESKLGEGSSFIVSLPLKHL